MKISIDGILGSAKRINSQRSPDEESRDRKKKEVSADSIEIRNRVLSRLDTIQKEFKEIQSSLTVNQIINEGMKRLRDDLAKGSEHKDTIMDEVRFDNKKVLHAFIGENVTGEILNTKQERIDTLIDDDITRLRILQVEVENILASNLTDSDRVEDIMKKIESYFSREGIASLENISRLRADSVMRLIK
jgi:hypothetical protein